MLTRDARPRRSLYRQGNRGGTADVKLPDAPDAIFAHSDTLTVVTDRCTMSFRPDGDGLGNSGKVTLPIASRAL